MKNENVSIAVMYGITPCHAGSGSSLGVVDLPIQRERASNWPVIQASGVKGAFRANFQKYEDTEAKDKSEFENLTKRIFGTSDNGGYAGSLSVSDAKILAYPMRSNISPFVWITCPAVLKRLVRDLKFAGKLDDTSKIIIPDVKEADAKCISGNITGTILLEDYEVTVSGNIDISELKSYFPKDVERLLVVSDDVFNYGVSDCTQIMAQIKIVSSEEDAKKSKSGIGTTAKGSLRYQEELPSDTIMYSVICWGDCKEAAESDLKADLIRKYVKEQVIKNHIQIAGDESCGRGIFKLEWK